MIKFSHGISLIAICSLMLFACKKDKNDDTVNLPQFGTCNAAAAAGKLSFNAATGNYVFRTSGGGTITINPASHITLFHDDYPSFDIQLWGTVNTGGQVKTAGTHESLNGKHLKDRISSRRTVYFPDGSKFTLVSNGIVEPILSISIYDGAECHHLNFNCSSNTIEWSTASNGFTEQLDLNEADGEAGGFQFTSTGLIFNDYYVEETVGNKLVDTIPIGEIFRANPSQVVDYWP